MRALMISLVGSLVVSGSTTEVPDPKVPAVPTCVNVRSIGALPLTVDVQGVRVRITEWVAKDVEATELIGFRATTTGPVSFVVRAGGETFEASGSGWLNPRGVVGQRVRGIDGLQVCR